MANKIITKRDIYTLIMIISLLAMLWGQILNQKVINANDCLMPVYKSPDADTSDKHFNYENKEDIKYWYLSDVIGWTNERMSLGDLFVKFGLIFFIAYITLFAIDLIKVGRNSS
jgi:hypothetical protein